MYKLYDTQQMGYSQDKNGDDELFENLESVCSDLINYHESDTDVSEEYELCSNGEFIKCFDKLAEYGWELHNEQNEKITYEQLKSENLIK